MASSISLSHFAWTWQQWHFLPLESTRSCTDENQNAKSTCWSCKGQPGQAGRGEGRLDPVGWWPRWVSRQEQVPETRGCCRHRGHHLLTLLSAMLTWLWPHQVGAQSIVLFVVQAAPGPVLCLLPQCHPWHSVAGGGLTCAPTKPHTRNVQQKKSTGQTSCAASAVGSTPKNVLSTNLQESARLGWQLG